jgi:hypothetical protein
LSLRLRRVRRDLCRRDETSREATARLEMIQMDALRRS